MSAFSIRGQRVLFLKERAVYLPTTRSMLVADLHWGKAEVFQMRGVAIPSTVHDDDLLRLSQALDGYDVDHLYILGDLTHSNAGVTSHVIERVRSWREKHAHVEMTLIRGNHDRGLILPDVWRIAMCEEFFELDPFVFAHDPVDARDFPESFVFSGHLHPTITLRGAADQLRLPCFAVSENLAVLPAFSEFTGGQDIRRRDWDAVFAIADEQVVEL